MKNIFLLPSFLLFIINFSFSQVSAEQALLSKVNSRWKQIPLTEAEASKVHQCLTNTDLIQLHLALVTEHLIQATDELSLDTDTKTKRLTALSKLTFYFQNRSFPINQKYEIPTPIFVDEAGTRCAVGELLFQTGRKDIVDKITNTSNLAFIVELNKQYDELGSWTKENGFSMDELAWIQPMYGNQCNPGLNYGDIINVSCHGGSDGGFLPDYSKILDSIGPEVIISITDPSIYYFDSTDWVPIPYNDCFKAGLYKQLIDVYNVVDSDYIVVEYFVEIKEPDVIITDYQKVGDQNKCQASIDYHASGGTPPFEYILYDQNFDTIVNANLCAGIYWVEVKDSHQCSVYDSINLLTTNIHSINEERFIWIFPNPASTEIKVNTNTTFPLSFTIISQLGQKAGTGSLNYNGDQIDISTLTDGIYYLVFENASLSERIYRKITKVSH